MRLSGVYRRLSSTTTKNILGTEGKGIILTGSPGATEFGRYTATHGVFLGTTHDNNSSLKLFNNIQHPSFPIPPPARCPQPPHSKRKFLAVSQFFIDLAWGSPRAWLFPYDRLSTVVVRRVESGDRHPLRRMSALPPRAHAQILRSVRLPRWPCDD
jgi:hypothetical protein